MKRKPKLAVWKFASCDGCQLTLLNCEDELMALAARVDIANFPEASRAVVKGPYDVSLVEGSITTPHDAERIREVRAASRALISSCLNQSSNAWWTTSRSSWEPPKPWRGRWRWRRPCPRTARR